MMPLLFRSSLFCVVVLTAGCSRGQPSSSPTPTGDAARAVDRTSSSNTSPIESRSAADTIHPDSERNRVEALRRVIEEPVFFEFDRFDLSSEARETLQRKLELLQRHPDVFVRVEGHADDRGSDEYNIALAQRRAAAAKRFFTQRGIDAERIETISFGEQRPVCLSPSESCWLRNRRDEFVVIGGAFAAGR